jgi:hypothetical protein
LYIVLYCTVYCIVIHYWCFFLLLNLSFIILFYVFPFECDFKPSNRHFTFLNVLRVRINWSLLTGEIRQSQYPNINTKSTLINRPPSFVKISRITTLSIAMVIIFMPAFRRKRTSSAPVTFTYHSCRALRHALQCRLIWPT